MIYLRYVWVGFMALLFSCKSQRGTPVGMASRPSGPPPTFDALVAKTYPINRTIEAPGTVMPNETTDLQTEIAGRVVSINFKEGSYVKKGTLLVKLFDGDLQAQLRKLQAQLKVAEATEIRQKELLAINGTSQQDYDNAELAVSNLKADIELLKVDISRTEIRAPFDGKLGLRNISLGAYVTPSTIITNISQVNQVKAEFAVPEKYASEMTPGRTVYLRTAGSNRTYTAVVLASQNVISAETRNLMVRAQVNNPDANLPPGAFVQVQIALGRGGNAIMVPSEAVIPTTRFKQVIVSREGKAVFQNVETGFRDSARIEILHGINVGDTVITNGLLTIKEGMPLQVRLSK